MSQSYEERRAAWGEAAKRVNEVNDANGWERPAWENLPVKIMLVVTELEEAVQATRDPTADPLNEELADVGVRLLHILESIWPQTWVLRESRGIDRPQSISFRPIETLLWGILSRLCQAVEFWRSDEKTDTCIVLEKALLETRKIAAALHSSILQDIKDKVERNAKRGHLHGRARSAG